MAHVPRWGTPTTLAVCVLFVAACGESGSQSNSTAPVRHPDKRFIRDASVTDPAIDLASRARPEPQLSSGPVERRLGVAEQPADQVFGGITAVAEDGAHRIYVLDSRAGQVSVYDTLDRRVDVIGRRGEGPGEFLRALSMALRDDSTLYVGDVSERVHIFRRPGPGRFVYDTSFTTGVSVDAMCFLGPDLIVQGVNPTDSLLLRRFDPHGRQVAAFGVVYRSPQPRANMEAARGRIACNNDLRLVAYAPQALLGEVRAFSAAGTQVWRLVLQGFQPISVLATATSFSAETPKSGFDRVDGLAWLPDSSLLVQVAHVTADRATSRPTLATTRLTSIRASWRDGRAAIASTDLDRVALVSAGSMISTRDDPVPAVIVRRLIGHR